MDTEKTKSKDKKPEWITGWLPTMAGVFPVISTRLTSGDIVGGWRVRWGIKRMGYRINPGLYAVGKPDASSPVLVTANYKLTFDSLRKHLENISAWILVLDTKGVNVWCAAGKGTFGTEELIRRIKSVNLSSLMKNRTLILPQLGAPGVAAHIVTAQTGFKVVYGPIRAADLPKFLANGLKTDPAMRNVTFTLKERLAVVPVELVQSWKAALASLVYLIIIGIISGNVLSWSTIVQFLLIPWQPYLSDAPLFRHFFLSFPENHLLLRAGLRVLLQPLFLPGSTGTVRLMLLPIFLYCPLYPRIWPLISPAAAPTHHFRV